MSNILSVRLDDDLWERVHSQQVQPRQTITEALLHYFRYKDGWERAEKDVEKPSEKDNVYNRTQQLADGSLIIDLEYAKLENQCEYLKKEIGLKDVLLVRADKEIVKLDRMVNYLQTVNYRMHMTFIPERIGFLAGLLPSGRRARKAKEEIDEIEHAFLVKSNEDLAKMDFPFAVTGLHMEKDQEHKEGTTVKVKNKVKSMKDKSGSKDKKKRQKR